MNNEFEFQVYEDTNADCLKVYKTEHVELVTKEWLEANSTKFVGKYFSEENGTSIKTGLSLAVKAAQKKRTVIQVYFFIENENIQNALPEGTTVFGKSSYRPSIKSEILHFITCKGCKRDMWFNLLEKTTLHHFIISVLYTINSLNTDTVITSEMMDEHNEAMQAFVYKSKFKFLALLAWYALYAVIIFYAIKKI